MRPSADPRLIIPAIAVIIIAVSLILIRPNYLQTPVKPYPDNPLPPSGPVEVSGQILCLPHRDTSGPQTAECAFGIRDGSGRYYGLDDSASDNRHISTVEFNTVITVKGDYTPRIDNIYPTIGTIKIKEIITQNNNWPTYTDPKSGLSINYPPSLDTEYIDEVDWPPKISVVVAPFVCNPGGRENGRAGVTEKIATGGRDFCRTLVTGAAAGSLYTRYAYASGFGQKTVILTFSLRFPQCQNYPEPDQSRCTAAQKNLNIDSLLGQIFVTLR